MKYEELKKFIRFRTFAAKTTELQKANEYYNEILNDNNVKSKEYNQVIVVLEELFVNIANYAYVGTANEKDGEMQLGIEYKNGDLYMVFIDTGIPFNPLEKEDPDLNTSIENKKIGGLGIYIAKQCADEISYERIDNKNILMFKKRM